MTYVTAKPPSTYVPPDIKREFRALLDDIHALDQRHGTHTPSATLLRIVATARCLGVPPEQLLDAGAD